VDVKSNSPTKPIDASNLCRLGDSIQFWNETFSQVGQTIKVCIQLYSRPPPNYTAGLHPVIQPAYTQLYSPPPSYTVLHPVIQPACNQLYSPPPSYTAGLQPVIQSSTQLYSRPTPSYTASSQLYSLPPSTIGRHLYGCRKSD